MCVFFSRITLVSFFCVIFLLGTTNSIDAASSRSSRVAHPVGKFTTTYNALSEEEFQLWLQSNSSEDILHIPSGHGISLKFAIEMGSFSLTNSLESPTTAITLSVRGQDLFLKKIGQELFVSLKNVSGDKGWVTIGSWIEMLTKVGFRYCTMEYDENGPILQLQGPK